MALYIPHSVFHLARLLYVRPETLGPYYAPNYKTAAHCHILDQYFRTRVTQNTGAPREIVE